MAARPFFVALVAACATFTVALFACTSKPVDLALVNATAPIPSGSDGDLIRYGRSIVDDTQHTAKQYVVADMNCSACHNSGGTRQNAGSFLGIYALFPQYNNGRTVLSPWKIASLNVSSTV